MISTSLSLVFDEDEKSTLKKGEGLVRLLSQFFLYSNVTVLSTFNELSTSILVSDSLYTASYLGYSLSFISTTVLTSAFAEWADSFSGDNCNYSNDAFSFG